MPRRSTKYNQQEISKLNATLFEKLSDSNKYRCKTCLNVFIKPNYDDMINHYIRQHGARNKEGVFKITVKNSEDITQQIKDAAARN